MHIGFVTPEYIFPGRSDGGLANYVKKTGQLLAERGHLLSVFVLSQRDKRWQDGPITIYEIKRVIFPRQLKIGVYRRVFLQYLDARKIAKVVWRINRAQSLDILQASSYMAPGYVLLQNDRLPIVCRVSSYSPLYRSAYGRQRNLAEYFGDWLEIRQVLDANGSFVPSTFMANVYAKIEGHRPRVIRSPMIIPDDRLDHSFFESHLDNKSYLLFFGTLSRIKGVDLLAGVIPEILKRHPDLFFVFIGRDDGLPSGGKMFEYLRSHCHSYEEKLLYWPAIPQPQLFPVIAKSVAVLMPSRVDNYPNACLEAQSLGIPVIGTYDSSLEEMIIDGKTGFLAENNDAGSICEAVERVLALTVEQRQSMRQNIIKNSQTIAAEDRIGQLVDFYKEIIDSPREK